jgi:hypothetical protein
LAVVGLTFKPGTDDLRDAPELDIMRRPLESDAVVSAFDPVIKKLPDEFRSVRLASDVHEAADQRNEWEPGRRRPKLLAGSRLGGGRTETRWLRLVKSNNGSSNDSELSKGWGQ